MRPVFVALLIGALTSPVSAQSAPAMRAVPQSPAQVQLSFAPVVAKVAPAVVNVYSRRVVRQALFNDPFFQQFFGGSADARPRVSNRWARA